MLRTSRARRSCVLAALLFGCAPSESEPTPELVGNCADSFELQLPDGGCIRPGVLPGGCAEGFVHDGEYGCEPVLPSSVCPPGLMAVPGDPECRPVAPCGQGTWGDIPVDATPTYVDQSYTGGMSDGSAQRPWTTVGAAVDAAPPSGLIAVAEGSYLEDLFIGPKPVRLWGVCPEQVEIVGTGQAQGCPPMTICIGLADGTEIRNLAVRGAASGIIVSGTNQLLLDRLWVHDNARRGIHVDIALGHSSVTVVDSLIENNRDVGLLVGGADATIEGTVVRGTLPRPSDSLTGRGIAVGPYCTEQSGCDPTRPQAIVRRSVVEQNHDVGLRLAASDTIIETTVVRGTLPRAADQKFGRGINIQLSCTAQGCDPMARATATLWSVLVDQNHDTGLAILGSDAIVDATTVRGTLPNPLDGTMGRGIQVQVSCSLGPDNALTCDPQTRATATLQSSLVVENSDIGVAILSSDVLLDRTVIQSTTARAADGLVGDWVAVVGDATGSANAAVGSSRIRDSVRAGCSNFGATVSLSAVAIQCAAFDLEGEMLDGVSFIFEDGGANVCGCPNAQDACVAVSVGLEPPEPLSMF